MICQACKSNKHELCPNQEFPVVVSELSLVNAAGESPVLVSMTKLPSGLSLESEAVQRGGLCPCHHKPWPVT